MTAASSFSRLAAFSLLTLSLAANPKEARWSSEPFGPDGPWNAVEVSIGDQPNISLFPGRLFHTFVTTSDYCAVNNSISHCASGTYLKDNAVAGSRLGGPAQQISWQPPTQELNAGIQVAGTSKLYVDYIEIADTERVANHSVALIESAAHMLVYPGGTRYPIFTGCLSIGAPDRNQIFTGGAGRTSINASMIPASLQDAGTINSNSFGLHYGSAAPSAKMRGSLLFGGYDRNRVVGPVLALDSDLRNPNTLQDIAITLHQGTASPFFTSSDSSSTTTTPTTIPNLLHSGNTSIPNSGLPVILDPCSPYLTLPASTCDAIASHLPVAYNSSLGLYLWNTSSPRYPLITASSSSLSFTLMGMDNTKSLTIHVPFAHLNLTLSPPFVSSPVPYFPCFTGGTGAYVLGRAFFQDAFLGAEWDQGRAYLAQAPGPNVPAGSDAVLFNNAADGANKRSDDEKMKRGIEAGGNGWEKSWEGVWKVLSESDLKAVLDGGGGEETKAPGESASDSAGEGEGQNGGDGSGGGGETGGGKGGDGLSTGAMAGIGVGAALGGMALVAVVGWCLWKRRAAKKETKTETVSPSEHSSGWAPYPEPASGVSTVPEPGYRWGGEPKPEELDTNSTARVEAPTEYYRVEAPTDYNTNYPVYEVSGDTPHGQHGYYVPQRG